MEITEVKVRLIEDRTERLRAFCTVTFDHEFVVRDIKIIDGAKGLFVAMPSRKLTDHCPKCGVKNHLRAKYCNECGAGLPGNRSPDPAEGSGKLHVDVAHPINSECRGRLQREIIKAYEREGARSAKEEISPAPQAPPEPAASQQPEPAASQQPEPAADVYEPEEKSDEGSFGSGIL